MGTCEKTLDSSILAAGDTSSYHSWDFIIQDDCYKMINQYDFDRLAPDKWYIAKGKTVRLALYRSCELVVGSSVDGFTITPIDMVNMVDAVMKWTGANSNSTAGLYGKLGRCHSFWHRTKALASTLGAWVDDIDWRIGLQEDTTRDGLFAHSRSEMADRARMSRPEYCFGRGGVGKKEVCIVEQ